jgi:hypothetical protein
MTWMEQALDGRLDPSDPDAWNAASRASHDPMCGLTHDEYERFSSEGPDALPAIVAERSRREHGYNEASRRLAQRQALLMAKSTAKRYPEIMVLNPERSLQPLIQDISHTLEDTSREVTHRDISLLLGRTAGEFERCFSSLGKLDEVRGVLSAIEKARQSQ